MKKLFKLFFIFFRIGALTIGGGYAMLPVIHKEIVDEEQLIEEKEFLDIMAVAQSIPGVIAVNVSTFIGYKLYGLVGAIIIALAVILPSFLIILFLANIILIYREAEVLVKIFRGIRPAVVGLMVYAVIKLGKLLKKEVFTFFVCSLCIILILVFHITPIVALIGSAAIGLIYGKGNKYEHID